MADINPNVYGGYFFSHKSYGINIDYLGTWTIFWAVFPFTTSHSFTGNATSFRAKDQIIQAGKCFYKTKTEMKVTCLWFISSLPCKLSFLFSWWLFSIWIFGTTLLTWIMLKCDIWKKNKCIWRRWGLNHCSNVIIIIWIS